MTEEEIIRGCKQNNAKCQRALFDAFAGKMMSICLRYASGAADAEDMLQNAFIKIFRSIQQFRCEGSFEGWIKKITVHVCLASLRKKNLYYNNIEAVEMSVDMNSLQAVSNISEKELIKMISRLPEGYRIIFNLYIFEGYTHDEIASMLNIEPVTSRTQLLKARKILQKQILSQSRIKASHDR